MRIQIYNVNRIEDSIKLMQIVTEKSINDPRTRELLICVTRDCDARDDICEVTAWFNFLKSNVKYMADPRNIDTFQTMERTLQFGAGDCDDMSVCLCAGLETLGFDTGFRVIQSNGSESWNHVYAFVRLPKRKPTGIMPLDLTLTNTRPGMQPPANMIMKYKDFPSVRQKRF